METKNYHSSITADTDPKKAFESISRVSEWWAKNLEGKSQNPGDVFTVHFGETFVTFKVVDVVADKTVTWQVIDCYLHWLTDKKEWSGTQIKWDISTRGPVTQIDFMHIGLVPEIECYNDCSTGWNFYVKESLFKLITEGKGLPDVPKNSRN